MISKFSTLLFATTMALSALLAGCDSPPPETNLATAKAKAEQCVEPTQEMRSNHMAMLDHQRDATVIDGIRTKKHSLNECINCHVAPTKEDGSPLHYGDEEHFCTTCHAAVGQKIDCFQCHADRPDVAADENYQHNVGSVQGHHFTQGVAGAVAPTANEVQMITQPAQPPQTQPQQGIVQ